MASDSTVVNQLQDLVSINIDSQRGWEEAAENTKDATLSSFFREMGDTRRKNAEELKAFVSRSGEEPTNAGSVSAQLHRWWINAKQAIVGGDAKSVLNEAERGEDSIKHVYENAMQVLHGSEASTVVARQFEDVRRGHDKVKALRDQYRNPRG